MIINIFITSKSSQLVRVHHMDRSLLGHVWSGHASERCVLTLHHSNGVFYLRFEQVDPHHRGQVLHIHLVHLGVLLHLKQKAGDKRTQLTAEQLMSELHFVFAARRTRWDLVDAR